MEFATPEFSELLSTFNDHGVKYLVVGGFAVMKYSEPRYTKDLDVWIEVSRENSAKVFAALRDFGARLEGIGEQDFAEGGFYQMGRPPSRIDIMMSLDGVEFEAAWKNRTPAEFRGVSVNFIGKEDLLRNKEISGRHQDLADIEKIRLNNK